MGTIRIPRKTKSFFLTRRSSRVLLHITACSINMEPNLEIKLTNLLGGPRLRWEIYWGSVLLGNVSTIERGLNNICFYWAYLSKEAMIEVSIDIFETKE